VRDDNDDLTDRVVISAAVKYLHNNCSEIAFRRQIKSLRRRTSAYVMDTGGGGGGVDDRRTKLGIRDAATDRTGGHDCAAARPTDNSTSLAGACRAFESWPDAGHNWRVGDRAFPWQRHLDVGRCARRRPAAVCNLHELWPIFRLRLRRLIRAVRPYGFIKD